MSDPFQPDFVKALQTGDATCLKPYLSDQDQLDRFAVYRNNVVRAAIEALRAAYPTVNRLVGEGFFSPMAKAYWQDHPPQTPSLSLYGVGFSDHVEAYAPAKGLPYLADIARHDRAWLEAHHAANQAVFDPAKAAMMLPEDLPGLATGLHVSVGLLRSDWPAYEIWRGNRYDEIPPKVALVSAPTWSMIWRCRGEVHHQPLSEAEHGFYTDIQDRKALEVAAERASLKDEKFDAGALFGDALGKGLLGDLP